MSGLRRICAAASRADLPFPTGAEQLLRNRYSFQDPTRLFQYVGQGVFQVRHGKTFPFYHAYLTTGDRAKNRFHEVGQASAGDLWKKCNGGQSVTDSLCSASNCTNSKCTPSSPEKARATAHIYHANQPDTDEYIPYCMFIPTCSACNNHYHTRREGTCWGGGKPLTAYCCSKVMFVELSAKTTQGKGSGKGSGN